MSCFVGGIWLRLKSLWIGPGFHAAVQRNHAAAAALDAVVKEMLGQ